MSGEVTAEKQRFASCMEYGINCLSQTTAVAMSWCLLMLAKHPDVQQKVRDEVVSVLGTSEPLTYENLDKLEYCACVVKETLR